MKILTLTNADLDPDSGSGKAVLNYVNGLRKLGHVVDVLEPKNFGVFGGANKGRRIRIALNSWKLVKKKLKKEKYDIIEFYGAEFWLASLILSKFKKRPFLVQHTNGLELLDSKQGEIYGHKVGKKSLKMMIRNKIVEKLNMVHFKTTDALVCMCGADRNYALDSGLYTPNKTVIIPHGTDDIYRLKPFVFKKENRVAFMGSWIPRKGINHLVRVMTKILKQNPELCFDLYGAFSEKSVILSNFSPELAKRIVIYPKLSEENLLNNLIKAKVFFFPSYYEGFGLATAEAMCCSCAVVTTPTGFGADLKNNEEALICDFNDESAMQNLIQELLDDDKFRLKISKNGWNRVQKCTWERAVKELEQTYLHWLQEFRKR